MEQDPLRHEIGLMFTRDMLDELGVKIEHRPLDTGSFPPMFSSTTNWQADLTITGRAGRPWEADPDTALSLWHSDNIYDGGSNRYAYNNPIYDELVEKQRQELDPEKRRELVWEAQRVLYEDAVIINIYAQQTVGVYNKDLFSGIVPMFGLGLFNFWNAMELEPKTDQRILRVAAIGEPAHMNVCLSTLGELEMLQQMFDTLVRIKPDSTVVDWAAESRTYLDPTTLRVKLRDGMTWHDGKPVTAEDVKFSFDYYKEKEHPRLASSLRQVASVDVVDDLTVDIHLEAPSASFPIVVLAGAFLIPKHIWQEIEDPNEVTTRENPEIMIGSGPFIFKHWRRGEELEYTANKDHFAVPKVDGVRHIMYENHEVAFLDFEAGKVDISEWQILPEHAKQAEELPHLEVVRTPDISARFLAFQTRRPPMNDVNFRKAAAYVMNYDHIVNVMMAGFGEKWTTNILCGRDFWANPNLEQYEYNPEKARQILRDAGYGWDADGRLHYPPK